VLPIHLRTQHAHLSFEIALPQRVAHDQHGLFERQRFFDVVVRSHLDRSHRRLDVPVARDDNHMRVDPTLPQTLQRGEPVDAWEPDIEHDHVVGGACRAVETLLATADRFHVESFVAQNSGQGRADPRLVIDD